MADFSLALILSVAHEYRHQDSDGVSNFREGGLWLVNLDLHLKLGLVYSVDSGERISLELLFWLRLLRL